MPTRRRKPCQGPALINMLPGPCIRRRHIGEFEPPQPTFIVETEYTSYPPDHGEGTGQAEEGIVMKQGDHALRRQLWSVSLGGGTGFGIIGNINDAVNDPLTTLNRPSPQIRGLLQILLYFAPLGPAGAGLRTHFP